MQEYVEKFKKAIEDLELYDSVMWKSGETYFQITKFNKKSLTFSNVGVDFAVEFDNTYISEVDGLIGLEYRGRRVAAIFVPEVFD